MTDHPSGEQLVADLIELLDLAPLGEDRFAGARKKGGVGRVFGGQVVAQALVAAERTVADERAAHSLHAYFLRGGSEDHEIEYAVDRPFDGGSFSNRRVLASQQGQVMLHLSASFHRGEAGPEHQAIEMPDIPAPDMLEPDHVVRERIAATLPEESRHFFNRPRPIEVRAHGKRHWMVDTPQPPRIDAWFRARAPLPGDPRLHRAVLAYLSDMQLLGTSIMPHAINPLKKGGAKMASLDHAIWFHAPFRADEWLLYSSDSPWAGGGRGFNLGRIFQGGRLVASVSQEGMIRAAIKQG